MNVVDQIGKMGIVPVVSLPDAAMAIPLAESLVRGGLPCAEITFRTAAAAESLALIARAHPDLVLGAGTVLTTEQADRAIDAGARFIVSPGTNPRVVEHCLKQGVPIFPGVCTPTEIETALSLGVNLLKFFPAESMGGVGLLKAVCAPYRQVRFIPTGGIETKNLASYLALPAVVACGGSWMVRPELIASGDYGKIEALTCEAVALVGQIRGGGA